MMLIVPSFCPFLLRDSASPVVGKFDGLDRLLTHADPDFPILRELDRGPAR